MYKFILYSNKHPNGLLLAQGNDLEGVFILTKLYKATYKDGRSKVELLRLGKPKKVIIDFAKSD